MDQLTTKTNMSMLQLMHEMKDRMTSLDNMLMKKSHPFLSHPSHLLNPPQMRESIEPYHCH